MTFRVLIGIFRSLISATTAALCDRKRSSAKKDLLIKRPWERPSRRKNFGDESSLSVHRHTFPFAYRGLGNGTPGETFSTAPVLFQHSLKTSFSTPHTTAYTSAFGAYSLTRSIDTLRVLKIATVYALFFYVPIRPSMFVMLIPSSFHPWGTRTGLKLPRQWAATYAGRRTCF